jgi:hypothetical protein
MSAQAKRKLAREVGFAASYENKIKKPAGKIRRARVNAKGALSG